MIRINRFYVLFFVVCCLCIFFLINILLISESKKRLIKLSQCNKSNLNITKIVCLIEGTKQLQCIKDEKDVYLPFFKFLKKQFDIDGKLNMNNFEYHTSYARIKVPEYTNYNSFAEFGHFGSYNVEIRDRVRCINPTYGVPMSVQWDSTPYFYPIQVAQFGLQHYSRHKTNSDKREALLQFSSLKFLPNVVFKRFKNNLTSIVRFSTQDKLALSISLNNDEELLVLLFSWFPYLETSWFSIEVEDVLTNLQIKLNYVFSESKQCVWYLNADYYDEPVQTNTNKELTFNYSLGTFKKTKEFKNFVLDIEVDTYKALEILKLKHKKLLLMSEKNKIRLKKINFYGFGDLKLPLKQQNKAHLEKFMKAAEWFLKQQNNMGGWSVPVQRLIADDHLILKPNWHSAMAQGHALSVLIRAYHLSKRPEFIEKAQNSLNIFRMNATKGGVVNQLFGNDWYEEYPTTPGTFVLNGFIYSLIGLYDATSIPELKNSSLSLFKTGINSLKLLLPLYDSGSGSIYDLRHLALKIAPNLARWDYHVVHIYLLKWLFNITGDKEFNDVADRWINYAYGKKAKHN